MEDTKWPRWRYHEEKKPEGKIVQSAEENEALGPGWVDTPADFAKVAITEDGLESGENQETLPTKEPGPISNEEMKTELDKADLIEILVKRGHKRRDLKHLSREGLLRMAEGVA